MSRCLDAFSSPSFFLKVPDFILMVLFSLGVAFDHYLNLDVLRPCLPVQGFPMVSLVLKEDSARLTAVLVSHFLPDVVLINASLTS